MKKCTKCGTDKQDTDFSWKSKSKGILHSRCKECCKPYSQGHYKDNKDLYKARGRINAIRWRNDKRAMMLDYLSRQCCTDCGCNDVRVLEFDHTEGKTFTISRKFQAYKWERLLQEIEKCEVRCCNCHRIKTLERSGSYRTGE